MSTASRGQGQDMPGGGGRSRGLFLARAGGLAAGALLGSAGMGGAQAADGGGAEMIQRLDRPLDLETPVQYFDRYITPTRLFFVRSHFGAPAPIDPGTWRLRIGGEVGHPLVLGLGDLRRFAEVTVAATLQCSGNGRAFFRPRVPGVQWERGAVGNALWTGVRLADVLRHAGMGSAGTYVWARGRDADPLKVPPFVRAIPRSVALHPATLLAYRMNGQPLTLLHGQPLRLIVPGWVGDDQVKWLTEIEVRSAEPPGFYYQTAYRYPDHLGKPGAAISPKKQHPLSLMNVKSLVASPVEGARLSRGTVEIQGVAWSGAAEIVRVAVSLDGGREWHSAHLDKERSPYTWRLWRLPWRVDRGGVYTIMARATDSHGATQPFSSPWNPSGYLWNAVDSVRVIVQ
ncbi:MAG: molybdopterin-dependent oxidoreductase [Chloroflexota bacterium]